MRGALKKSWQEYAGTRALIAYLPEVSWPLTIALVAITLLSALAPVVFNPLLIGGA